MDIIAALRPMSRNIQGTIKNELEPLFYSLGYPPERVDIARDALYMAKNLLQSLDGEQSTPKICLQNIGLRNGDPVTNSLHVTIAVSGWLSQKADHKNDWNDLSKSMEHTRGGLVSVRWSSGTGAEVAINSGKGSLGDAVNFNSNVSRVSDSSLVGTLATVAGALYGGVSAVSKSFDQSRGNAHTTG